MQNGQRIVFAYLVIFLIVPAVGHLLSGPAPWNQYHYFPPDLLSLAAVFAIVAVQFLPFRRPFKLVAKSQLRSVMRSLGRQFNAHVWLLNLVFAALLIFVAQKVPSDLRYMSAGITSTGTVAILLLGAKAVVAVLLLHAIVRYCRDGCTFTRRDFVTTLALVIAYCLAIGGQSDLLSASIFVAFIVFPKFMTRVFFIRKGQAFSSPWRIVEIAFPAMLLVQLYFVLYFGEGIKSGLGLTPVTGALEPDFTFISTRILDRLASHYYSLMFFLSGFAYQAIPDYLAPLSNLADSMAFRWQMITGSEPNWRPDIQSMSRYNFTSLSIKQNYHEGTSAGVYASFSYIMPLPIAIVVSVLYLKLVASAISRFFFVENTRLTIAGTIIFLHEVLFFFQSPVDFILIFDNTAITAALFVVLALICGKPSSHNDRQDAPQKDVQPG